MIVAGGPHFVREPLIRRGKPFSDSIIDSFGLRYDGGFVFDGVVEGGFQAFIEIASMINGINIGDLALDKIVIPGFYYALQRGADSYMGGSGISANPKMKSIPFFISRDNGSLNAELIFSNICGNGCGFCTPGAKIRFNQDQVAMGAILLKNESQRLGEPISTLAVHDANPFSTENIGSTRQYMDIIWSNLGRRTHNWYYIDSSLFRNPSYVLSIIKELNIDVAFVGRDSVCEEAASLIGVSEKGMPKTQAMLDSEKEGLLYVIKNAPRNTYFKISYIISPFDESSWVVRSLDEMKEFVHAGNNDVHVIPLVNLLAAYSGSKILHKYIDYLTASFRMNTNLIEQWDEMAIKTDFPNSVFPNLKKEVKNLPSYSSMTHDIVLDTVFRSL